MAANEGVRLNIRVQPKASRNALTVAPDGQIRVALTAPPVEGKANKALVAFLAERFGVPKRDIALIRGAASREKVVEIKGVTIGEVDAKLRSAPGVHD